MDQSRHLHQAALAFMTEFWHNHFNVNPDSDTKIAVSFPEYDREVIRKNCLGNFREFLEDVAKSTAMQYYLDNASSKQVPPMKTMHVSFSNFIRSAPTTTSIIYTTAGAKCQAQP